MKKNANAPAQTNFSPRSAITFLVVGGFATGLHYLLAAGLVLGLGVPVVAASAIGFTLSAIANYALNARLTFRSRQPHATTAPRFFVTAAAGLLINSLLLALLLANGLHAVAAQLLATLGVLIWNYIINGLWTFKRRVA